MKKLILSISWIALAAVSVLHLGCYQKQDDIVPRVPGKPSGGVRGLTVASVTGNKAVFKLKLFALNQLGNFINDGDQTSFSFEDAFFDYNFISLAEVGDEQQGPYSAMMLFDQSGSITSSDPEDARLAAGKAFVNLMDGEEEAALTVFSGSDPLYGFPYTQLVGFTTKKTKLNLFIDDMAGKESGSTPLFISMRAMLDTIDVFANNDNKALIAFTDGEDTQGGNIDEMIQTAIQKNIQIYTVGLKNFNASELTRIALSTNGSVMLAEDAPQLISLYNSLGDMLRGEGNYMEVTFEATNPTGDWQSGWGQTLNLIYQPSPNVRIAFPVYLYIP